MLDGAVGAPRDGERPRQPPEAAALREPIAGERKPVLPVAQAVEGAPDVIPFVGRNQKLPKDPAQGFGPAIAADPLAIRAEGHDPAAAVQNDQQRADHLAELVERQAGDRNALRHKKDTVEFACPRQWPRRTATLVICVAGHT